MADAQHGDGEERAAQAQDRIGDGGDSTAQAGPPPPSPSRSASGGAAGGELSLDQTGAEGADADEGGVAEAGIAGETAQDRPGTPARPNTASAGRHGRRTAASSSGRQRHRGGTNQRDAGHHGASSRCAEGVAQEAVRTHQQHQHQKQEHGDVGEDGPDVLCGQRAHEAQQQARRSMRRPGCRRRPARPRRRRSMSRSPHRRARTAG